MALASLEPFVARIGNKVPPTPRAAINNDDGKTIATTWSKKKNRYLLIHNR